MKKIFLSLLVIGTLSINSQALILDTSTVDSCDTSIVVDNTTINSYTSMSNSLLQQSTSLLNLAHTLEEAGAYSNTEYINAMLQLSKDIGEMADRILVMAGEIGTMSNRIVTTIEINEQTVALTQANALEAGRIFTSLLAQ